LGRATLAGLLKIPNYFANYYFLDPRTLVATDFETSTFTESAIDLSQPVASQ
jgi:hypothetical protein